jgi:hypothetical protein
LALTVILTAAEVVTAPRLSVALANKCTASDWPDYLRLCRPKIPIRDHS